MASGVELFRQMFHLAPKLGPLMQLRPFAATGDPLQPSMVWQDGPARGEPTRRQSRDATFRTSHFVGRTAATLLRLGHDPPSIAWIVERM